MKMPNELQKHWVVDGVTKGTIRHLLDEHHVRPHHVWGAFEEQHRHLHARKQDHDHPELAEALERARGHDGRAVE